MKNKIIKSIKKELLTPINFFKNKHDNDFLEWLDRWYEMACMDCIRIINRDFVRPKKFDSYITWENEVKILSKKYIKKEFLKIYAKKKA